MLATKVSGYGKPEIRFWRYVNKDGPIHPIHGQCWLWTGGLFEKGYGAFSIKNVSVRAHRYSWVLHNGEIPDNQMILHKCDNPSCVNPKHLFIGTQLDNITDMVSKQRHPHGKTHGSYTKPSSTPKGSGHGMAKLTEEIVKVIRDEYVYKSSEYGSYALAKKHKVSQHLIMLIVKRRIWTHV